MVYDWIFRPSDQLKNDGIERRVRPDKCRSDAKDVSTSAKVGMMDRDWLHYSKCFCCLQVGQPPELEAHKDLMEEIESRGEV